MISPWPPSWSAAVSRWEQSARTGWEALAHHCAGVRHWFLVLGLLLALWEIATAKLAWLPLPFFPPPQAIIEVYTDDLPKLLASVLASVKLQLGGYVIGAVLGFVTGVAIGWSRSVGYWVHPLLRFIGPLPATRVAAVRVLHVSVQLERQHVLDRPRDRLSGHGADLVRRGKRQQRLL